MVEPMSRHAAEDEPERPYGGRPTRASRRGRYEAERPYGDRPTRASRRRGYEPERPPQDERPTRASRRARPERPQDERPTRASRRAEYESEPPQEQEERPTRASRRGRKVDPKTLGKIGKKRSFWKELPILIVVALVLTILIQQFFAKVYMIPSGSMESTLHGCNGCVGDRILVDRITYDFADPGPGDVVVFKGPPSWVGEIDTPESSNVFVTGLRALGSLIGFAPPDERDFVKRIIATGGQTVQCCDPQNRVMVDGKALDEPYVYWEPGTESVQKSFDPVQVPTGYIWVMGDNRNNSSDSRFQGGGGVNGAVPVDNIIGKARVIVLPPGRWGGVTDHNPQTGAQPVALGAPAWQEGLPLGVGLAAAWPVVFLGRRMAAGVRKAAEKRQ